jgi:outer membrane lipoprotein SlyB
MSTEPNVVSLAPQSMSAVPRAVWIGGGLLALVTAALAGALVMRSVEPASTALATTTAASAANSTAQPVPLTSTTPPTQVATATPAKPAHSTNPASPKDATSAQGQWNAPGGTTRTVQCTTCGVVEAVNTVHQKGQGTGLGAVAGGVLGGVLGHQVGGGKGKTAMTVLGAVGGGLAGNEVEKRARGETLFDVQVRMEDGSLRTFQRAQSMAIGTHVVIEGKTLRVARDAANNGTSGDAPRTLRTSAPAGGSA